MSFLRKMEKAKAAKKKTSSENQACNSTYVTEELGKKLPIRYPATHLKLLFCLLLSPILSFLSVISVIFYHFYYSNSFLFLVEPTTSAATSCIGEIDM